MSTEVRTYNSSRVLIIYGGVPLTGLAPDTFVSFAPSVARVTSAVGADGEIARSVSSNRMWDGTVNLQQTSPSNDYLSGCVTLDELTGGAVLPLLVQDLSGRTLLGFSQAWISGLPTVEYGAEVGNREWSFQTGAPNVLLIGGNL